MKLWTFVLLTFLALVLCHSQALAQEEEPWLTRNAPEDGLWELGFYWGGFLPDSNLELYDANPAAYQVGERVKVSHMLFREKARALEMLGRAKAGEPFEALMKEVGSGNGEVAADLGEIERGNFVKEFEAAAFAAAPGVATGPVKTTYGYHVIKVYAKLPAGARSFEEVKPKLLAEQREQAQRGAFEGLIGDLRKQATVRVLYKPEGPPVSPGTQAPGTAPAPPKAAPPGR